MNEPKQTRLDQLLDLLKNNKWICIVLLLGVCIIALGTFTDSLRTLLDLIIPPSPKVEQIPYDEIPFKFDYSSGGPLEFSEIMYSQEQKQLDVRVRNTSDNTIILNYIYLYVMYIYYDDGGYIPANDAISVVIEDRDRSGMEEQKPFSLRVGYRIACKIEPKGADRYLFDLPLNPGDIFYPPSIYGEYKLVVSFSYNKGELISESVNLENLL